MDVQLTKQSMLVGVRYLIRSKAARMSFWVSSICVSLASIRAKRLRMSWLKSGLLKF